MYLSNEIIINWIIYLNDLKWSRYQENSGNYRQLQQKLTSKNCMYVFVTIWLSKKQKRKKHKTKT